VLSYVWDWVTSNSIRNLSEALSNVVTAAAIVIGGGWAYFKYFRHRTFRPRLSVDLLGEWRQAEGTDLLHIRVRVTNIGASKVALNQYGSGLNVGFATAIADHDQVVWELVPFTVETAPVDPDLRSWTDIKTGSQKTTVPRDYVVLDEHGWIEPGETVSDDLLLNLGREPEICVLEVKLLWALSNRRHGDFSKRDIEVFARRILPVDAKLTG